VIYLDTSALVKLIREAPESPALGVYIDSHDGVRWFTSELARTEVPRAVRRLNAEGDSRSLRSELGYADKLWESIDLVPITSKVLSEAGAIEHPFLRSLDAIHLATAAGVKASVTAFVTYDKRLATVAKGAGLPVTAPA